MPRQAPSPDAHSWKIRCHTVIFGTDTRAGKAFDVVLLVAILLSVLVVALESVPALHHAYLGIFLAAEWGFTIAFTIEYILRLACVKRPSRYAMSFYGQVDLLAILPTYLSMLIPGVQSLLVIRALRLLRVFRIFKLTHLLGEATALKKALVQSRGRIIVFLTMLLILAAIAGSTMYLIEGAESGFTSIPQGMYWAVVTMTTVGYGDLAPITPLGKAVAGLVMIAGYSMIVVPTGIVSAEIARITPTDERSCSDCFQVGHEPDARYCRFCGGEL
jgi:voltage-gated potassium channel